MEPKLSLEEKRRLARRLLLEQKARKAADSQADIDYSLFLSGTDPNLSEIHRFEQYSEEIKRRAQCDPLAPRLGPAGPAVRLMGSEGPTLNFSTYNYLGLSAHPQVVEAAKEALDTYGLGCGASPNVSGNVFLHQQLEEDLVAFYGLKEGGASLFSSGYNVNTGTISALMGPGCHLVLDQNVHMSIVEGGRLAGATVHYFDHNDSDALKKVLNRVADGRRRVMVCLEGVYSADGDRGRVKELATVSKEFGALVLLDEAHSALLCGPGGRGMAAADGALDLVDLLVLTFSKSFGGIGGGLVAHRRLTRYVDWYARSRVFSCAITPAVTAGIRSALALAAGPEGERRRERLCRNGDHLRSRLQGKVPIGSSQSWIIPVIYGSEKLTLALYEHVRLQGLDGAVMEFPAVPRGEARLRLFVTSEHTTEHLDRAAEIILETAERFGFLL